VNRAYERTDLDLCMPVKGMPSNLLRMGEREVPMGKSQVVDDHAYGMLDEGNDLTTISIDSSLHVTGRTPVYSSSIILKPCSEREL